MTIDEKASREFLKIQIEYWTHDRECTLTDEILRNFMNRMVQLSKKGDTHAISYIEKAKLSNCSDNIKENPIWKMFKDQYLISASSPNQKSVGGSDQMGLWKPENDKF